jgi:hypothetical protein
MGFWKPVKIGLPRRSAVLQTFRPLARLRLQSKLQHLRLISLLKHARKIKCVPASTIAAARHLFGSSSGSANAAN